MRALTVQPGKKGSGRLEDIPEPPAEEGGVLVQTLAVGVCGTDREILDGDYGWPPPGRDRLVLGHESLGRVREAPPGCGLQPGDLVVGIVRLPDPVPCSACAVGQWDMCRNGQYTEHGIKQIDGFCRERYRIHPQYAVKLSPHLEQVGVLLEPTSIVAKAWDHLEKIGHRAAWAPRRVLVTGAGPVGLLAALLGVQRGLEVHVLDRLTEGPKPGLVRDLGAHYHTGRAAEQAKGMDIVIECTGVGSVVLDVIRHSGAGAVVCLAGLSPRGRRITIDADALNEEMVLENEVVFGSVNANRRHYELAAEALARADVGWLGRLISPRVPLGQWPEALERQPNDVKVVLDLTH